MLSQVDHACLAIIAFSAGAELQMGDLRRIKKQVLPVHASIKTLCGRPLL